MKFGRGILRAGLLALLALGIGGCIDSPLSPLSDGGTPPVAPSGPQLLTVEPNGQTDWTPATVEVTLDSIPVTSRALETCADIDGSVGGRLRCGRFVLAVPAGAFVGKATICMSMADSTVMVVDLKIDQPSLNLFAVPVKLCLITEDTTVDESTLTIYWWDPSKTNWTGMACDRDLTNDVDVTGGVYTKGVLTLLGHFSRYGGGKAGW